MKPIITTQKARKRYKCAKCGAEIAVGQYYRRITQGGIVKAECLVCKRELPKQMLRIPSVAPRLNIAPKPKTPYDLDENYVTRMMIKMYALGQLAWDYADTCIDISTQMRVREVKKVSRAIRQLKTEYDAFSGKALSMFDKNKLTEIGELFERANGECFSRLCNGLRLEIGRLKLNEDYIYLVQAAQMAMTIVDTMKLYDKHCADWLTNQGCPTSSIVADHFNRLALLVPQFAGDAYNKDSEARMITSKILYKELLNIEIYDRDGKV